MQTQITKKQLQPTLGTIKTGKKRGRKPLPFVAQPTPSSKVLKALEENALLDFDGLQSKTKLSDEKLGLALSTLIITTRQVSSFSRNDTRFYRLL